MPYKIVNNKITEYNFNFNSFYKSLIVHPLFVDNQSYISKWFDILNKINKVNELYNVELLNAKYIIRM